MNFSTLAGTGLGIAIALVTVSCGESTPPESAALAPGSPSPTPSESAEPADSEPTVVDVKTLEVIAEESLSPTEIWQRLAQPGDSLYVVMLRHALAPGTGDPSNFDLADCSTQRNLSAEGRSQAQQIGQAFQDQEVSVRQVLSSQWCRCLETAQLMDLGPVEPYPPLNSFFRDRSTATTQTTDIRREMGSQVDQPGVVVMVTHQVNITELTDIVPLSGEAVVLEAQPAGIKVLGTILPDPS